MTILNNDFFHDGIKKAVVLFGTMFNECRVTRYNADGSENQTLTVPIEYGPREKALSRVTSDSNLDRAYAALLPRMSFQITGFDYDGSRKLPSINKRVMRVDGDTIGAYKSAYMPVAYNIGFELSIMVKNAADGNKIVEQILPYFTPDWTLSANLLEDMPDWSCDIPLVLNGVSYDDQYDDQYEQRRVIIWTLNFTMKTYFFGPVKKAKVIKFVKVNLHTDTAANTATAEYITIQPGLDANGFPTTDANTSIPYQQIEETDNWAYIINVVDP